MMFMAMMVKKFFYLLVFLFLFLFISLSFTQYKAQVQAQEPTKPSMEEIVTNKRQDWLATDLKLLCPAPTNSHLNGWKWRTGVDNLKVYERPDPSGDANNLFYYWNDAIIDLPLPMATRMFSSWIDLSKAWTKEFTSGRCVATTAEGDQIWHQRFDPNITLVAPRDLLAAYCVKKLTTNELEKVPREDVGEKEAYLISCRSVKASDPSLAPKSGDQRIDWHGAYLLTSHQDGKKTRVRKLDRENQKGWFPAFMMNNLMPGFLNEEVEKGLAFINDPKNREDLCNRYEIDPLPSSL